MNKFLSVLKGFIIGAANIVPGISSGTLMVVFNVYDRFVDAANLFLKHPFKAIWSIFDILVGFVFGIIGSFLLVSYTYKSFPLAITLLILGLVFGGYRPIIERINGKQNLKYILIMIISAVIVAAIPLISQMNGIFEGSIYYIILLFLGLIVAFFLVAPGISGSLVLLIFGYYYHILDIGKEAFELIIKGKFTQSLPLLLPIIILAISVIIGMIFSFKLIKKIIEKYETGFYFGVLGVLIGSPFAILILLFKNYKINSFGYLEWIVGTILLIAAFFLFFYMIKLENNNKLKDLSIENKE